MKQLSKYFLLSFIIVVSMYQAKAQVEIFSDKYIRNATGWMDEALELNDVQERETLEVNTWYARKLNKKLTSPLAVMAKKQKKIAKKLDRLNKKRQKKLYKIWDDDQIKQYEALTDRFILKAADDFFRN